MIRHYPQFKDKENKPEVAEEPLTRQASRNSLCPPVRGFPFTPVPRRNSLIFKHLPQFKDKENKPDLAEEPFPRQASRVSLCPPVPRRDSLIPLPVTKVAAATPHIFINAMDNISPTLPSQVRALHINGGACEGETRSHSKSSKKINSILRRSLQKKVIIRPQLPQSMRKGGNLSGLDKLRLSVGRSGRRARRIALGSAAEGDRATQQKQHREKERGWNHRATTSRNILWWFIDLSSRCLWYSTKLLVQMILLYAASASEPVLMTIVLWYLKFFFFLLRYLVLITFYQSSAIRETLSSL